jgi:transposase
VWTRIFQALTRTPKGPLHFIDSTYVRVHQSATNPAGGQSPQAMGPSRGGLTTKIHAVVDRLGRPIKLVLTAGNVADSIAAPALFPAVDRVRCSTLVADKGYDSDGLRAQLVEEDIFPCFAATSKRLEKRPFHKGCYRRRHRVENFFCSLKKHRRISTRYDKLASSFLAFVTLASILCWIPKNHFSNTP